jgi:hypothetical protein
MPGRHYPGCVIQGDSLSILYGLAKNIHKRAKQVEDAELASESKHLLEMLDAKIRHYEAVLDAHGISIPYHPNVVLKDILDWQEKH